MALETLLEDRSQWQQNTIKRIQDSLLNRPETSLNIKEEKLVVVYGPTQIGKTTLILYLMGISDKRRSEIYNVLRAGIPRGNSSTSTAIIYQHSSEDFYELGYKNKDGNVDREVYESREAFEDRLKDIRKDVEEGKASTDVLHIYIPHSYFDEGSEEHSNISILDLPGDRSRNRKESQHADVLIRKYMSLASVNIIACRADSIQSLENLQIQGNKDWKHMGHRYILVTTSSYGQSNIKKFFQKDRKERKNFLDFVKNYYANELEKVLGSDCQIESFLLDVGDSLDRLCNEELKDFPEEDRKEVRETTAQIAEELRKSIQQRSGNSLKAAIDDLRNGALKKSEDRLNKKKQDLKDVRRTIEEYEEKIKSLEKELENYNKIREEKEENTSLYEDYRNLKKKSESLEKNKKVYLSQKEEFVMDTLDVVVKENLKRNNVLKDRDKKVSAKFQECIKDVTRLFLNEFKSNSPELSMEKSFNIEDDEKLTDQIYEAARGIGKSDYTEDPVEKLEESLYSCNLSFVERFRNRKKYDECMEKLCKYTNEYLDKMWKEVYCELKKMLERKELTEKINSCKLLEDNIKHKENKRNSCQKEIEEKQKEKERIISEIEDIEKQKKVDEKTLNDFRTIAEKEYSKQVKDIENDIRNHQISGVDLMPYIIYLALLEKNFNQTMLS
ncbi:MAG: hypothetical protein LUE24_12610 [Lachnospiraceae bacterium]|nr:hypothetical protein [Lachnospiraceae bacterium]